LDKLQRHLQEGHTINKEQNNLLAIPLKNLDVKVTIQEATDTISDIKKRHGKIIVRFFNDF
jgi:hypothetical protein